MFGFCLDISVLCGDGGGACDDKEIMSVRVNILENEVRRLWDKFVPMAGA